MEINKLNDLELIELSRKTLSELCKSGAKSFKMTIPVENDDTDVILGELIKRFETYLVLDAFSK